MYSSEIIEAAGRTLSQRRQRALALAEERRAELYQALPRLKEIEGELAELGAGAAKAALSGGDVRSRIGALRQSSLALQEEASGLLGLAGLPGDYLEPPYACKACRDTGYRNGRRCACLVALIKAEAYKKLPAPGHLRDYSFEAFSLDYYPAEPKGGRISPRAQMTEVLARCRDYARNFSGGDDSLLLMGRTGLGKTHLSLAIAASVMDRGFGVVYTSAQELVDRAERDKFGRNATGEDGRFLRYATSCELLIIDDLGSEFITQLSAAVLFHVVNTRLLERRATLISTNLTLDEMQQKYDQRLISRMLCAYVMLPFAGEDVRMLKSFGGK